MTAFGRAWGRFRRLSTPAQAGAGLVLLAAYTLALVIVLGGGDNDDGGEERQRPLTAMEKQVKQQVEQGQVPQRDATDVALFRRPAVTDSQCDDTTCTVTYSIAVPGRGRVEAQQADIVAKVFRQTDVERLTLKVVRGQPTGPRASPKTSEETPIGVPLYQTTCDRSKLPDRVNLRRFTGALAAFAGACEFQDVFQAGPGSGPGAPGSGAGGGE